MEERKAFNFLASYYRVFKKLPDNNSKAEFISAICEKQFNNIDPENLSDFADLAYEGQRHSIEASRKGFEDVKKRNPSQGAKGTPSVGGSKGGKVAPSVTPRQQEKEKEKEEEKEQVKVKEKVKDKNKIEGLVFAFSSESFLHTWNLWLNYRREQKKTIKGRTAAQGQMNKLARLSGGSEQTAQKIVMQSIENNWTGLFELKNTTNGQNQNGTTTKQTRWEKIKQHNIEQAKQAGRDYE